jgi:hypothetical protein
METVGNQFGESKGEEQARKADEALELHHNSGPFVGASRQSDVIKETQPAAPEARVINSEDSLNWASGQHVMSSQPGEPAMTVPATQAAAVSGPAGIPRVKSTPDLSGGCSGVDQIINFRGKA